MIAEKGKVYLIGAGPYAVGLVSLAAIKLIQRADVIVYDYHANPHLLEYARADAELIYVGKKASSHTLLQDQINELLVQKAGEGKSVARLKGGDPFVFGRGGEECQMLAEHDVPFEIIPGITSAIAAPAYAAIPITHRDYASTVTFITGHESDEKTQEAINYDALATIGGTLVFLMGVKNLEYIAERLQANGLPGNTPAALIQWGTAPFQKTITSTIKDIAINARKEGIKPPAILVVGQVVKLREQIMWLEKKPLFAKKVIVTRAPDQSRRLKELLEYHGAEVITIPTIQTVPIRPNEPLHQAITELEQFNWIIFTSINGVKIFFDEISKHGYDARHLCMNSVAAVGEKTAEELADRGIKPDLVPKEEFSSRGLLKAFKDLNMQQKTRILIPRAAEAPSELPGGLREMGAEVLVIPIYKTVIRDDQKAKIGGLWDKDEQYICTFTSSSTVNNFMSLVSKEHIKHCRSKIKAACIGPVTAKTAREHGLQVIVEAKRYTAEGLVEALIRTL